MSDSCPSLGPAPRYERRGLPMGVARLLLVGAAAMVVASGAEAQEIDVEGVGFVLGDEAAPITVVEFADMACSACGAFARDTWPALRERYVDAGRVRWRVVPFELGFRNSDEGAKAVQCGAEQERFWALHDALFERQSEWVGERRPENALVSIAASIGLDRVAFAECYDDDAGKERTDRANRAARRAAVRGTPTFFIDGFRVQGALPLDVFVGLLEGGSGRPIGLVR